MEYSSVDFSHLFSLAFKVGQFVEKLTHIAVFCSSKPPYFQYICSSFILEKINRKI